jgi:cell division protein FtsW
MSLQRSDEKTQNVIIAPPDRTLVIVTIFLIVIGIMSIFSATSAKAIAENQHPAYYLIKQTMWLVAGIFGCWAFTKFDYRKLRPLALPFAFFVIILLLLTAFTPLGVSVNGAKRWLYLGVQFQPSEFSKLAIILCMADAFAKDTKLFDSSKIYLLFCIFTHYSACNNAAKLVYDNSALPLRWQLCIIAQGVLWLF